MESASPREGNNVRLNAVAAAMVALLHVGFYQLLVHGETTAPANRSAAGAMRIEFIERLRTPVAQPRPRTEPAAGPGSRQRATPRQQARDAGAPSLDTADAAVAAQDAPLVMEWTDAGDNEPEFRMNLPDGRLPELLAMDEPGKIRVRRQISGKDVVEGAAQLLGLWPEGYAADSCPRIKRSIAGLMTDGSADGRALLGEELRRQRAKCRE